MVTGEFSGPKARKLLGWKSPAIVIIFCCVAALLLPLKLQAVKNPKEQYKKIQKEIESHREKLRKIKEEEHSTLEDIDRVNRRINTTILELGRQRSKIKEINAEIKRIEIDKAEKEREMERERAWLIRRLRALQRYGRSLDVLVLLTSTDDAGEIMRRWKYLERLSLYEKKVIEDYSKKLEQLSLERQKLMELSENLKRGEERIRLNEATLLENKKEKELLLVSIRREKSSHEKVISELEETSKKLLDLLKNIEKKEKEKEDVYTGKGFSLLKGKLPWPINGRVAIPYGSQVDPRFNTPVFRNGIYIEANDETVRSVLGGKVVFSDWFKGYGNLVIINHGEGYHTLYGNLSETFFKAGDIIKERDVIGKVGESGMLNGLSLYFEVRYKGRPLNPLQWLKRK